MAVSKMRKLSCAVLSSDADRLMKELQRMKCTGIEAVAPPPDGDTGDDAPICTFIPPDSIRSAAELPERDVSPELGEISEEISALGGAISFLDEYHTAKNPLFREPESLSPEDFEKERMAAAKEAMALALEMKNSLLSARRTGAELEGKIEALLPFAEVNAPLPGEMTAGCEIIYGTIPPAADVGAIDQALAEFPVVFEVISQTKTCRGVFLAVLRETRDECLAVLSSYGFVKTTAVATEENGFAAGEIEIFRDAAANNSSYINDEEKRAGELSNSMLGELKTYMDYLTTKAVRIRESAKLRMTESCAVIGAFVPAKAEEDVALLLSDMGAAYEFSDPEPERESVPVQLSNGALGSQFEPIVGLYSYPKYGAFDPTSVMSIFYILIFGLMFADVGYGLTLLAGCLLGLKLMHPREGLAKFLRMFAMCGVSSMVGGALFGGYFGDLPTRIMEDFFGLETSPDLALAFNMVDDPMAFFAVSLCMGGVHLLTGMGIKFVLMCKDGHPFAAVFDVGSWFVLFAGIGLYFIIPTAGLVCAIVGVLMLVFSQGRREKNPIMKLLKGIMSLYDLISYGSDLLSYSRILALGLASAVIANVVNIFGTMGGPGIGGVFSMTLAFLIGHTLNFAVNILGTYVHTSRLQYIEFFGKFYEDGGRPFAPLAPESKYVLFK